MALPLDGRVALVAGATRGAGRGIAVALGEAGATGYCTGRTTRERRSEYDRPETIEETALGLLIRRPGGLVVEMTDGTQAYNASTYRINASTTSPRTRPSAWPSRRPGTSSRTGAPRSR